MGRSMEIKRAYIQQQEKWVPMSCDRCGTLYSCKAEAWGYADTGLLGLAGIVPSDDTMRELARVDLNAKMRQTALRVPCPKCACYNEAWVERAQARAGRVAGWLAFVAALVLILAPMIVFWPKAPSWSLFIIAGVAWAVSRLAAQAAKGRVDPNRSPEANRRLVAQALTRGVLRIDPPAPESPQAL